MTRSGWLRYTDSGNIILYGKNFCSFYNEISKKSLSKLHKRLGEKIQESKFFLFQHGDTPWFQKRSTCVKVFYSNHFTQISKYQLKWANVRSRLGLKHHSFALIIIKSLHRNYSLNLQKYDFPNINC